MNPHFTAKSDMALLIALNVWLKQVGVTTTTAWRWRRRGWLRTVNVAGRVYITREAIEEFTRRAESGEFEKEHRVPTRYHY